jgi:hypothetical protein
MKFGENKRGKNSIEIKLVNSLKKVYHNKIDYL